MLQICPSDAMKIFLQIYQLKLQVAEIDSIAILQSILFLLYVSYCTEQEGDAKWIENVLLSQVHATLFLFFILPELVCN